MSPHHVPLLQTDALPTLCNRRRCLASRAPGSPFCVQHTQTWVSRARQQKRKPSLPPVPSASVFVVQGPQGLKFGCARDVSGRVERLSRLTPNGQVRLYGQMPGAPWLVESIVRHLSAFRLPGEWFAAESDVLRIAGWVRDGERLALERLSSF